MHIASVVMLIDYGRGLLNLVSLLCNAKRCLFQYY